MIMTHLTKEVITDAARSSARVLRTPRHVSRIERDGTTPGRNPHAVRYPQANSQVLIEGNGILPNRGLPDHFPLYFQLNCRAGFGSVAEAN